MSVAFSLIIVGCSLSYNNNHFVFLSAFATSLCPLQHVGLLFFVLLPDFFVLGSLLWDVLCLATRSSKHT